MSPKPTTGESPTKIQKKRNLVTVTEDYHVDEGRFLPITKHFEVDQDDLRVVDLLIRIQQVYLNGYLEEVGLESRSGARLSIQTRQRLIQYDEEDKERRLRHLILNPLIGTELPKCIERLDALESLDLLNASGLTSLPHWIGNLKALKNISLPISGKVRDFPDEFWDLTNMEQITHRPIEHPVLYDDIDFGPEPGDLAIPESIGKLRNLRSLHLSHVTFLPEELANLGSLEELTLNRYEVTFLPSSIGKISNLKKLKIQIAPRLRTLPKTIGHLKNLKELQLDHLPDFRSLPDSIGDLTSLEKLAIRGTSMQSFPSSIASLSKLEVLDIFDNEKLTTVPDWLGTMTSLKILNVHYNRATSIPQNLFNLRNLEHLDLSGNSFKTLPDDICNLTKLKFLGLSHTCIEKLPDEKKLKKLKNLRYLRLDGTVFDDDDKRPTMWKLSNTLPWVWCFGDQEYINTTEDTSFFHSLFLKRLKAKVLFPPPPLSLWPLILAAQDDECYNDAAFDGFEEVDCACCSTEYNGSEEEEDDPYLAPSQADIVFRLLVEFGPKLISSESKIR